MTAVLLLVPFTVSVLPVVLPPPPLLETVKTTGMFNAVPTPCCVGVPVPATFLTTLNSFSTNIASPAAFNPANSNVVYTPPDSKWPRVQNWFFSVQRELPKNTVLELAYNGNHSTRG